MNDAVFRAARRAGCSPGEAEVVATYVESEGAGDTALKLDTKPQVVLNLLARARRRMHAPHNAALIVAVLAPASIDNHSTRAI